MPGTGPKQNAQIGTLSVRRELEATLCAAVENLLRLRQPQGHWGDVRSTALAVWALSEYASVQGQLRESSEFRLFLEDCRTWLAGQAKREEGGISWDSEAWDTSMAVIALTFTEQFRERRDQAAAWLQRIRYSTTGIWYDEVWETTLCSIALLRAEMIRTGTRQPLTALFRNVLAWLNDLPSKASGEFLSPHYSGFIAWLLAEILGSYLQRDLNRSEEFGHFTQKVDEAVKWLVESASFDSDSLWTPCTFANAYTVYGLCKLSQYRPHEQTYAVPAVNWFTAQQGTGGGYEDTEDTALAVLALTGLLLQQGIQLTSPLKRFSYEPPRQEIAAARCFIGYSGKSAPVAAEIKEFISRTLPGVIVRDWKWDFQLGQILFSEIDTASRECRAAIFLITKDDQLTLSDRLISSPRDNIVFEVGFFAARLGMTNTLLLVEEGTKLPTDWGGILYIPIADRSNLSSIHTPLLLSLKRILSI